MEYANSYTVEEQRAWDLYAAAALSIPQSISDAARLADSLLKLRCERFRVTIGVPEVRVFAKGDIVWLNSGGPLMEVVEAPDDGDLVCEWTDGLHVAQRGRFATASLTREPSGEDGIEQPHWQPVTGPPG